MTRSLQQLIDEQNRLAQTKAPDRPRKVVRVLVANRYSGPDLKAIKARVGDVIAVAGGRYADELVALGYVELAVVEEPQEQEPEGDPDEDDDPPVEDNDPPPAEDPEPEEESAVDAEEESVEEESVEAELAPTSALAALNIGQLRTMAKFKGVNSASMTKAELVEALLNAP